MLKGLLSGVIWGAIVSVLVVVGASLNAPLPGPRTGTIEIPAAGEFGTIAPEIPLVVPATEPEPNLPDPNRTPLEDPEPIDAVEVAPEGVEPERVDPDAAISETGDPETSDPEGVEPDAGAPEAATPEESASSPVDDPVEPEAPETSDIQEAPAPEPGEPETPESEVSETTDPEDSNPTESAVTEEATGPDPAAPQVEGESPETGREPEPVETAAEPGPETPDEVTVEPAEPVETLEPIEPEVTEVTEAPEGDPAEVATPEAPTPELAPSGAAEEAPTLNAAIGFGGGALLRNALDISVDTSLPLFSIIVIDRSGSGLPLSEVATYPAPLTVALDPTQPGAITASEGYKATGHEVLILANSLPPDAAPLAAAAALTQLLNQMPAAVGVLLPPGSPFVRDASRASELTAILAQSGHGLVSLPQGLDALGRAAAAADVPDAEVFRVLDSQEEGVPLMTRYLDRAAFQAARDGSVVVLGIVQPNTMEALNQWLQGRRAATVAVAPISKLMLPE